MKRLANPSQSQLIALGVFLISVSAVFAPPLQVVAQPSPGAPATESEGIQSLATPQALPTPVTEVEPQPTAPRSMSPQAIEPITGQGTAGNIAKFTGANSIGNSVLYETGGKVGIGTTTPSGVFSVNNGKAGVYGIYSASTGNGVGGTSSGAIGVYGFHSASTGAQAGVLGETHSAAANAIGTAGVILPTSSGVGSAGVRGINNGTGANGYGVYGSHAGGGDGVYGSSASGSGVHGTGYMGIYGVGTSYGIYGSGGPFGVYGSGSYYGLCGSGGSYGVYGSGSTYGIYGYSSGGYGVSGASSTSYGVRGDSSSGSAVVGFTNSGYAVFGRSSSNIGVYGYSDNNIGVYGRTGNPSSYAAYFQGNVYVNGNLGKASGSFKIDHPLHPATEYLSHSFVESPDMMNVYNGNTKTNSQGEVWVHLPDYFSSLNRDFRYQLTPIGQFAQAIVGQKIKGNRFLIRTDKPNVEVSWQVTGVRNDAYARQHRIRVEETKTGADRGKYLYPAGFGFGKDRQIGPSAPRIAAR